MRARHALPVAGLLAALCATPQAARADYPDKPITVICASGAGGIVDVVTRIVVEHMGKTLGVPMVVQNEAGAGSTIAIASTVKAAPDGYTILSIGSGVAVVGVLFPKAGFDVERDLAPVSIIGVSPMVVTTSRPVPVKDYAGLIAYAKAHPGELTGGSNGRGTSGHFAIELFKKMAGIDIRYIPYRTSPQAQGDLIGGHLSLMMTSPLFDHVKSGALRFIAVTIPKRWDIVPDVPTLDELDLKGFEAVSWSSMFAPRGTPPEMVGKINAAIVAAVDDQGVKERLAKIGAIAPDRTGPEALRQYLNFEIGRYSDVLRDAKPD